MHGDATPPSPISHEARFPKSLRVRARGEFLRVQNRGRKTASSHFVLAWIDRGDGQPARIGFTLPRKVGTSPRRNRIRRLLREVFRLHKAQLPQGCDCVVMVKSEAPDMRYDDVRAEFLALLKRAFRPR